MILEYEGVKPKLGKGCYVAPTATLIGDLMLGDGSSIWFNTVVRADVHSIRIGRDTNVQDLCMLHVTNGRFPLTIGDEVTVGHHAVVHGATLGDRILVGMGAIILDGSEIGSDSIVAAGSLVVEGSRIPPGSVIMGAPAKRVREVTERDKARIREGYESYRSHAARYRDGQSGPVDSRASGS